MPMLVVCDIYPTYSPNLIEPRAMLVGRPTPLPIDDESSARGVGQILTSHPALYSRVEGLNAGPRQHPRHSSSDRIPLRRRLQEPSFRRIGAVVAMHKCASMPHADTFGRATPSNERERGFPEPMRDQGCGEFLSSVPPISPMMSTAFVCASAE